MKPCVTSPTDTFNFETVLTRLKQQGWNAAAFDFLKLWQGAPIDLKYGLMAGAGLLNTGREIEGAALLSHMADRAHIIRTAQFNTSVDPVMREASQLADKAIRTAFTQVQTNAIAACTAPGRIATALWPQTHYGPPPFPKTTTPPDRTHPRPYVFYAPDLPPVEIFDAPEWAAELSKHSHDIRAEFLELMNNNAEAGAPYVEAGANFGPDWAPLKGQKNWNAVHLFKDGTQQTVAKACPATCAALSSVPITRQNDVPIEAFFSVLKPGTTIPPHYGLANCRVTVHLPLIVPSADPKVCGIRVGEKTAGWRIGEPFLFDDSFDHSAWNLSDETRVVLIFEAWRPDMTDGEINAVKASYEAREAYLGERTKIVKQLAGLENA